MIPILAASLISMPLLIKCAIFGGVACGAWVLLDVLAPPKLNVQGGRQRR